MVWSSRHTVLRTLKDPAAWAVPLPLSTTTRARITPSSEKLMILSNDFVFMAPPL